jgi:GTP cyclohydrolase II
MSDALKPDPARLGVERAIAELRRGRPVLVAGTDGAVLTAAAETATPESLALARAQGLTFAMVITANRAAVLHVNPSGEAVEILDLPDPQDRAAIRAMADPTTDLAQPLKGPFRRHRSDARVLAAHRAAVQLAKLARLLPAVVAAVVPSDVMAAELAHRFDLLVVGAEAIETHEVASARAFRPEGGGMEHLAILVGEPDRHQPVLARLHSECFTGDLLGSLKCDCGDQLRGALNEIAKAGGGVLLYIAQEGRGIGLINKLRAYSLQDEGFDTVEANERIGFLPDERVFEPAAEMLKHLGFSKVRLMTNNPDKVAALAACGIEVTERVPHAFPSNAHNEYYLLTKRKRSGHYL